MRVKQARVRTEIRRVRQGAGSHLGRPYEMRVAMW